MKPKTILVVDDSPTDLQLVTAALEGKGYHLLTATDGEEALLKTVQQRPDLVLLDIILPKKNGFQVCRQLKSMSETRHIKIIVLSGKSQESDRYWGLKQGADEYIIKPYSAEQLVQTVARHIQE